MAFPALSPELVHATLLHFFRSQQETPPIDPAIMSKLTQPTSDLSSDPAQEMFDQHLNAMENEIHLLREKFQSNGDDADDEGDSGESLCRRSHAAGFRLVIPAKFLTEDEKMVHKDIARRIRQVMKSLTERGETDVYDEEDGLPADKHSFVSDYDEPPRFPLNEKFIVRTVELVSAEYDERDPETGHFISEMIKFTKKDLHHFATTTFKNKKRMHMIQKDISRKKKADRARRMNRRHGRQRHTKETRQKYAIAYKEKYGVKLPEEIFQMDYMMELVSELDSTAISDAPNANNKDKDEDNEETKAMKILSRRHMRVKTERTIRYLQLASHAVLLQKEKELKVKLCVRE
ncbi:hypothetical protein ACEPAI_7653 [Sanghuangporus weigelae]